MDRTMQLIIIDGKDKTDSIAAWKKKDEYYYVTFHNTPKQYRYRMDHVEILKLKQEIDPSDVIPVLRGTPLHAVQRIADFGGYYRIAFVNGSARNYPRADIELQKDCLKDRKISSLYEYFKATAAVVGLVAENGSNILTMQYDRIKRISEQSVLSRYLDRGKVVRQRKPPETLIYPFGLNQSQCAAVQNAFNSQVSIIQGPPGTGKTQTILNIIANAVRSGETVAVVSNNNSATLNVAEKLEKKQLSFLTAFLGSTANKEKFLETQSGKYPDMHDWVLEPEEKETLDREVTALSAEVNEMLNMKNRIAAIAQELLQLTPEQHYFGEYYATYQMEGEGSLRELSSQKLLALWAEYEDHMNSGNSLGLLKKISLLFRYNRGAIKIFSRKPELIIPYLQRQFYEVRKEELEEERAQLQKKLENYAFDDKTEELTEKSLRLFRHEMTERYRWQEPRKLFEKRDFRSRSDVFNKEYPVVLSTTYSIKGTLSFDHLYDYLIIDEASQVDLATGVLALASAKNVVIVGDLKQLPNVLTEDGIKAADKLWEGNFDPSYRYTHHSLLSSAVAVWPEVPTVLLREHYRCHPKIIDFCNQKFYDGQLIVMTKDQGEEDALTLFRTAEGNHARGHVNQREIDVIRQEVIPRLHKQGYEDIGIITPYRDQVKTISQQLGEDYDVATVHKFQGREKDAIILTSVDNVIGEFVDDPRMLNVAVSRAVKALAVVTSQNPLNDRTNYGDLARYIAYQNCEVINSKVYSVFDMLYQSYAPQRKAYLKKHKQVSVYDSENLLYSVIEHILQKPEFSYLRCAVHVSLPTLIRDYEPLDAEERKFAGNPLSHTDFLIYNGMDKSPVLAIELDGTSFHQEGSLQGERDTTKDQIFKKCGISLMRIRTDESGEEDRIVDALRGAR